jgi:putative ABC transport system substrate-binding protein
MIEETRNAVQELADIVDFWMEPSGPLGETSEYTEILLEHSTVPIAFGMKLDSVKMGALIHVTPNMEASGREAALVAVRILTGENPGQIPVTPPSDFDLGLNLATALRLNIVVPPDILQLAGEHVYR